ncbi:MAG: pilus assembly protein TadG-related protein [Acidobacteria bacterium]|nr:pilus assembly protein TadG-related protein [Acidobacteriota bacterium]
MNRENERGQAVVLTVVSLAVMLGMCALVLDVGAWFRTDRQLQATADAAALAGAQELPKSPSAAQSVALDYAGRNGGNVAAGDVVVTKTFNPNDTISVKAAKTDVGIFSQLLGIDTANISAGAKARVDSPLKAQHVAPMVVHCNHPLIQNCDGNGSPVFGVPTVLNFDKMGAPGAFGMLNLNKDGGTPGTSEQAEWILRGHDAFLDYNKWYRSNPGAKFSSSQVKGALDQRMQPGSPPLLFPTTTSSAGSASSSPQSWPRATTPFSAATSPSSLPTESWPRAGRALRPPSGSNRFSSSNRS